jgi:hypothetical protein
MGRAVAVRADYTDSECFDMESIHHVRAQAYLEDPRRGSAKPEWSITATSLATAISRHSPGRKTPTPIMPGSPAGQGVCGRRSVGGRIGIFIRSYYEEVLVVRVHQDILQRQRLPPPLVSKPIWDNHSLLRRGQVGREPNGATTSCDEVMTSLPVPQAGRDGLRWCI